MSTSNFNLRGIPEEVMALLKQEAKRLHISVNVLILKMIEKEFGFSPKKTTYHDLVDFLPSINGGDSYSVGLKI